MIHHLSSVKTLTLNRQLLGRALLASWCSLRKKEASCRHSMPSMQAPITTCYLVFIRDNPPPLPHPQTPPQSQCHCVLRAERAAGGRGAGLESEAFRRFRSTPAPWNCMVAFHAVLRRAHCCAPLLPPRDGRLFNSSRSLPANQMQRYRTQAFFPKFAAL